MNVKFWYTNIRGIKTLPTQRNIIQVQWSKWLWYSVQSASWNRNRREHASGECPISRHDVHALFAWVSFRRSCILRLWNNLQRQIGCTSPSQSLCSQHLSFFGLLATSSARRRIFEDAYSTLSSHSPRNGSNLLNFCCGPPCNLDTRFVHSLLILAGICCSMMESIVEFSISASSCIRARSRWALSTVLIIARMAVSSSASVDKFFISCKIHSINLCLAPYFWSNLF